MLAYIADIHLRLPDEHVIKSIDEFQINHGITHFDIGDIKHGLAIVTPKQEISLSGRMVFNEPTPIGDQMFNSVNMITAQSWR